MGGLEQRDLAQENEKPSVIVYVNDLGQTLSVETLVPTATAPANVSDDARPSSHKNDHGG